MNTDYCITKLINKMCEYSKLKNFSEIKKE